MTAATRDLVVEQGATWGPRVHWADPSITTATGWQARLQARVTVDHPDTLLDLDTSPGAGITLTVGPRPSDNLPGIWINIRAEAADTEQLPRCTGVYDLELEDPGGTVWRVLQGRLIVSAEVTR